MSQFDSRKDYYTILGADEGTSPRELDRLYKRMAAQRHPDKGGNEEDMKTLNEAYRVLKDEETRKAYDTQRGPATAASVPITAPTAKEIGLLG
ncbi:MAG: DnaJ domain-containing protein, partial [Pyrinomonadaceae bacterium]